MVKISMEKDLSGTQLFGLGCFYSLLMGLQLLDDVNMKQ